ncbi:MAG: ribosome biogenesis GTPase Der, partial [Rhodospirillaceae bacterium]|nr:ribosome biogenesis GTPase Der [Rhodospirillaceae bacterium]
SEAHVTLFMIDARAGLTPIDEHFSNWLRTQETPVILLANKCEGHAAEAGRMEAYALGLGDPLPISAEHGGGLSELYDALEPFAAQVAYDERDVEPDEPTDSPPLQMAIVGRPNVGKSTMVNKLLGEDRMLTGPEAGITRDAITIPWQYDGREIRLVDTAGMRRRGKIDEKLEILSVQDSRRAIQYAEVVVLVLDSNAILEKQDLTLARQVVEEGRALIIAVNKWDVADNRKAALRRLEDRLQTSLPQVRGIPVVTLSAKTGKGLNKLMPAVFELHQQWNQRVSTSALNQWLHDMTEAHAPPVVAGRRLRLRYITQAKARPPTFIIFSTRADKVPESYLRYLANGLREDFDLWGVPLRFNVRQRENPYADKRN